ncbi:MAG TPA: PqqD family protein [Acidimicrobiales bacterium]|nr:PqqD family protein [Acidimicrobiales bacterium]
MSEPERWKRNAAVLWRAVLDDAVLLIPDQVEPLALSGGAALWSLLEVPQAAEDLARTLGERTGASRTDVEGALRALLARLVQLGAVDRLPP